MGAIEYPAFVRPARHDAYRALHALGLEFAQHLVPTHRQACQRLRIIGDDQIRDLGRFDVHARQGSPLEAQLETERPNRLQTTRSDVLRPKT